VYVALAETLVFTATGLAGTAMAPTTGALLNTVTVKEPAAVFPWASVLLQVTFVAVVPVGEASGKLLPLGGAQVTASEPSTMSVAVAE
jgi:hypothetical protein